MDQLSRAFAALADPTRRALVAQLTGGDATVSALAAPYEVSVQAVSKHLKVLERAGLVSRTGMAHRSPVHLEVQVFDLMTTWIERYRQQAEERYRRLDAVLAELADDGTGHDVPTGTTRTTRTTSASTARRTPHATAEPARVAEDGSGDAARELRGTA